MAVDILLNVISAHSILVQALKFGTTFSTNIASTALLFKDHLRTITHHFGRLPRDLWLKVELVFFLLLLESSLLLDDFISAFAIIDEEFFRWGVTSLLDMLHLLIIDLWLESHPIDLLAALLAASIAQPLVDHFSLLQASVVETLTGVT